MSLLSVCPFVRTGGRGSRVDSGRPGTAGDLVGEPDDLVADHLICEAQHPVGRLGKTEDIGSLAVYLASDASSWLTGQDIVIDGGLTLS